jgi:SH3-like domain-containing protein
MTRLLKNTLSIIFFLCLLCSNNVIAKQIDNKTHSDTNPKGRITNLPLPRFVTLKNAKTYMRSGPGKDYALLWVYQKKGLPVQIIDEYEQWRRIKDIDGSEGWIHQSVLSGRRMVITLEGLHHVYEDPDSQSDIIAKVDSETILVPEKCTDYYCYVNHSEFSGWMKKEVLYGVDDTEKLSD